MSRLRRPGPSRRTPGVRYQDTSGAGTRSSFYMPRTRAATKTSTCTPSIRRPLRRQEARFLRRNLTDAKGVRAVIYLVPRSDPDLIYIGLNDRDKAWHDLYKVRISTGERTLLRKNTERVVGWDFDTTDKLRLAT